MSKTCLLCSSRIWFAFEYINSKTIWMHSLGFHSTNLKQNFLNPIGRQCFNFVCPKSWSVRPNWRTRSNFVHPESLSTSEDARTRPGYIPGYNPTSLSSWQIKVEPKSTNLKCESSLYSNSSGTKLWGKCWVKTGSRKQNLFIRCVYWLYIFFFFLDFFFFNFQPATCNLQIGPSSLACPIRPIHHAKHNKSDIALRSQGFWWRGLFFSDFASFINFSVYRPRF